MERRSIAPVRYSILVRDIFVFLILQAIVILFLPAGFFARFGFLILAIAIGGSILLGWRIYTKMHHMVLSYDDQGFTLTKGVSSKVERTWREFDEVSIAKTEHGDIRLRLYAEKDSFELPATDLKQDPFVLREEVQKLIQGNPAPSR